MTSSKVQVHDIDRLINNMLEQGPRGMMLRELIFNGIQAKRDPKEGDVRLIRIYSSAGKLIIINSGAGMDASELYDACQIAYSGSHKNKTEQRGEGAKVASLIFNPLGMRYRSRKNGVISQATISYDPVNDNWPIISVTPSPVALAGSNPENNITAEDILRYSKFVGDFTEVKLLGMSTDHQTAYEPYDDIKPETNSKVPYEVFNRFYKFPEPPAGLTLDLKFDNAFTRGNQTRPFRTVSEVISYRLNDSNAFEHIEDREVTVGNNIRIEYVKHVRPSTKKPGSNSGGRTPWSNYSQGRDAAMGAIVYRGEMYDVHTEKWSHISSQFGVVGLQNQLSVFIHLPDDYPVSIDRYRERLMRNRTPVSMAEFAPIVAASRPQWLIDMIQQSVGIRRNDRTAAAKLLKYMEKQFARKPITDPNSIVTGGAAPSGKSTGTGSSKTQPSGPGKGNGKGNGSGGVRQGGVERNKSGDVAAPPQAVWITNATCDGTPLEQGFGAVYSPATDLYFLNSDYWMFQDIMSEVIDGLAVQYPGVRNHLVTVKALLEPMIKTKIEFDVGVAILRIKEKARRPEFSASAITKSFEQESLSTVYDHATLNVPDLVRDASKVAAIQTM